MADVDHNTLAGSTAAAHGHGILSEKTFANAAARAAATPTATEVDQRVVYLQVDTGKEYLAVSVTAGGFRLNGDADAARVINTTSPITGGGNLTADRTFALDFNALNSTLKTIVVHTASIAALPGPPTYANGTAGVGATLTFAACPATIGGVVQAVGISFLDQWSATPEANGVYVWTTYASGGAGVATRIAGFDTATSIPGTKIRVLGGKRAGGEYQYLSDEAITMGTTQLYWPRVDSRISLSEGIRYYDDFTDSLQVITAFTSRAPLTMQASGAASSLHFGPARPSPDIIGTIGVDLGSTNTGFVGLQGGAGASSPLGAMGYTYFARPNYVRLLLRFAVNTLSTGTNEYALLGGLYQENTAQQKLFANGVGAIYDRTSAVSTTNYLISTRLASAGTPTDTGVTAASGAFVTIEIWKYPGSVNVNVSVNGAAPTVYSSGYPTTTDVGPNLMWFRNVGTTGLPSVGYIDKFEFETFTPLRG